MFRSSFWKLWIKHTQAIDFLCFCAPLGCKMLFEPLFDLSSATPKLIKPPVINTQIKRSMHVSEKRMKESLWRASWNSEIYMVCQTVKVHIILPEAPLPHYVWYIRSLKIINSTFYVERGINEILPEAFRALADARIAAEILWVLFWLSFFALGADLMCKGKPQVRAALLRKHRLVLKVFVCSEWFGGVYGDV